MIRNVNWFLESVTASSHGRGNDSQQINAYVVGAEQYYSRTDGRLIFPVNNNGVSRGRRETVSRMFILEYYRKIWSMGKVPQSRVIQKILIVSNIY